MPIVSSHGQGECSCGDRGSLAVTGVCFTNEPSFPYWDNRTLLVAPTPLQLGLTLIPSAVYFLQLHDVTPDGTDIAGQQGVRRHTPSANLRPFVIPTIAVGLPATLRSHCFLYGSLFHIRNIQTASLRPCPAGGANCFSSALCRRYRCRARAGVSPRPAPPCPSELTGSATKSGPNPNPGGSR